MARRIIGHPGVGAGVTVTYLGGILARSERYMRDHWAAAKGFLRPEQLHASAAQEEADWCRIQQQAGLDLLAPALVRWEDLLRPFTRAGTDWEPGALTRYFETNTFYRQPTLRGPAPRLTPAAWFEGFAVPAGKPWVLTLPTPWDFAARAKDERGRSPPEVAGEAAAVLQQAVAAGRNAGAALVRFHDPSILYPRASARDVDAFASSLAEAAKGHTEACTLHLTNGDPFAHPDVLQANPLRGLSIEDPGRAPARLSLPNVTRLSVAAVRGEDSLVEGPAAILASAQALAQRVGLGLWGITNGWDLDHVPHAIAVRKTQALVRAKAVAVAA